MNTELTKLQVVFLQLCKSMNFPKEAVVAYLTILKDEHLKEIMETMGMEYEKKGSLLTPSELSEIIHNELMQVIHSEGFREKLESMRKK